MPRIQDGPRNFCTLLGESHGGTIQASEFCVEHRLRIKHAMGLQGPGKTFPRSRWVRMRLPSFFTSRLDLTGDARRKLLLGISILLGVSIGAAIVCAAAFGFYYVKYARMVDEKLRSGILESSSMLYAAPRTLVAGSDAKIDEIASYLTRCGYSESNSNGLGWYRKRGDTIEIHPGPDDYIQEGAEVQVQGGRVARIVSPRTTPASLSFRWSPKSSRTSSMTAAKNNCLFTGARSRKC